MIPFVKCFFDDVTNTATYVVSEPDGRSCAVIDSVLDYEAKAGRTATTSADNVIAYIRENKLNCEWILETHAHADHFSAAPYLKNKVGGKIAIGEHIPEIQRVFGGIFNAGHAFKSDGSQFDELFKDGEIFHIGAMPVHVIFTPGHTPACVSYHIGDAVFVGDTLFMPDYGTARCDFPGGDAATLYSSIQKIFELPDKTRMFLCHDYKAAGRDTFIWENRPDREVPFQPRTKTLATRADKAGITYYHLPVISGNMTQKNVDDFAALLTKAQGPVLAFCRTGTRSANLWAQANPEDLTPSDITHIGAQAGYAL